MKRINGCQDIESTYDIIVVGAGPAGMNAASTASASGLSVLVLDENATVGGQIYRNVTASPLRDRSIVGPDYWQGEKIAARFEASACHYAPGAVVWHLDKERTIGVALGEASRIVSARHVIIATGAIERPFPVEGWTLPGVMTVGAAQILLKSSAAVPRGRAVLAGTGPLLWLYAWQCIQAGAPPSAILDTTPRGNWLSAMPHLPAFLSSPYLGKGLALLRAVRSKVRVVSGVTELAIKAHSPGLSIEFRRGSRSESIAADHVLLHQGVVPNVNLVSAAGCDLIWDETQAAWQPQTDAHGLSSVPGISIVGDGARIGGAELAAMRGEIMGQHLAQQLGGERRVDSNGAQLTPKVKAYERGRPFLDALYRPTQAFRVGAPSAIACRCEEITCGQITETVRALDVAGPNQIKAFLRTGMGPCQGRYCGATVSELIAAARGIPMSDINYYRLRSPVKPITLGQLASVPHNNEEAKFVQRI